MEPCVAYKSSSDLDESIGSYEGWLPTSYDSSWSSTDAISFSSGSFYQADDFSSPTRYSSSSFEFPYNVGNTICTNSSSTSHPSIIPSTYSSWSQPLVTPPVTPQQYGGWHSAFCARIAARPPADAYIHSDSFTSSQIMEEDESYLSDVFQFPLSQHGNSERSICALRSKTSDADFDVAPFNQDADDPALSQQMFHQTPDTPAWQASYAHCDLFSPPKTVAPKATFQKDFQSSPLAMIDASTPDDTPTGSDFEYGLGSSPLPVPSKSIVPSQNSFDDFNTPCKGQSADGQPSLVRSLHRRSSRRAYGRKHLRSVADRPSHDHDDGICDDMIPANAFVCTFPGCLDKTRGKPKSFRRQEHRKRHEKTVHGIEGNIVKISCWVPTCPRSFTRTDNLKQHYKTHGKNSSTSRNRYVATLDEDGHFFDPHWRGALTEDGFPSDEGVRIHPCWVQGCGKSYHLQSKLKTHLLQQHGRKSSNPAAIYVATLDENNDLFDPDWQGQIDDDGIPQR